MKSVRIYETKSKEDCKQACQESLSHISSKNVDLKMATDFEKQIKQYIKIKVRNPRTHISREKALYTDYEVKVETNSIAFSCTASCVRRRYSDFQWLRTRLTSQFALERTLPELPPKRVFGRFKKQFLRSRQKGLQIFLEDITRESTYLSDIAVHLFLQTPVSVKEIEMKINGTDSGGELLEELQSPSALRGCALSRSCSAADDTNFDHDSGFSYSTASSLNDYLAPHHNCKVNYTTNDEKCNGDSNVSCNEDIEAVKSRLSIATTTSSNTVTEDNELKSSSNSSSFNSDNNYVSEDDGYFCHNYDADDEVDGYIHTDNNNKKYINDYNADDDEDEELFSFRKSSDQTVYTLERALEIIQERPKLTEKLFTQDDSDDCFRESEYDVIDTEDDLDVVEVINDANANFPNTSQIEIRVRSRTLDKDGRLIEVTTTPVRDKNKLKTGKVKSLPSIRFPIRNRKLHYRSTSEVSLISTKHHKLNTVYDDLILQKSVLLKNKSESDGQQGTSDADYLTTIHRYNSNDSQVDTNIDTQAEDIAPTKFLSMLPRRRRRRSITSLDFSKQRCTWTSPSSYSHSSIANGSANGSANGPTKSRFQVSTVREVPAIDNQNNIFNSFQEKLSIPPCDYCEKTNGELAKCSIEIDETDMLLNDDVLENMRMSELGNYHNDQYQQYQQQPQSHPDNNFLLKSYEII